MSEQNGAASAELEWLEEEDRPVAFAEARAGAERLFRAETMLRRQAPVPAGGWRRGLYRLSGGRLAPRASAAELHRRELLARVKAPVRGCRRIAFVSRKGGVGKTSTCLLAGHTFAAERGDRVVALDGNPDAGSLGYRVRRETPATVTTLLAEAERLERYADVRALTSQAPSRLEVVAADDDPAITEALGEEDFRRAIALLERHYNLVLLDTGTGVLESATRGILEEADQIVVVLAPSLDSARAAALTLDWLEQNGYGRLVAGAVAALNGVRGGGGSLLELREVERHFGERCRACVRIPWDPHLEAGAETEPEQLRPETQNAYLELAAAIAAGFSDPDGKRR